jgi:FlaA1/EpsC-like NDP-sugar epimerase
MNHFLKTSLSPFKILGVVAIYTALLSIAFWVAFELRFEFQVPGSAEGEAEVNWQEIRLGILPWLVLVKLIFLLVLGEFRGIIHYFRLPDLTRIFIALALAGLGLVFLWYWKQGEACVPRSVILADLQFSFVFLCAFRLFCRLYAESFQQEGVGTFSRTSRVGILGTGEVAASVAADLLAKRGLGMKPVLFLDEAGGKLGKRIHGVPVRGLPENFHLLRERYDIDKVIIAPDGTDHFGAKAIAEWVRLANEARLEAEIVPSLNDLASGRVRASRLRRVEMEDLLGRPPVDLDSTRIKELLNGRIVLVTGAGGTIGSELVRQILRHSPKRVLLVDQVEGSLFHLERELAFEGYGGIILPIVADILDEPVMRHLFEKFHPAIVFHAAAYKHVSMMERQPAEAIKNNCFGTALLARLAAETRLERFIFISSDKAINPTSVMGATKRLAELGILARQAAESNSTRFMAVRFGNVLGSSGSVIPIFREQIAKGGPITVTHPETTRYFMTIAEAAGLVLQSATLGKGGEIFVLDMGEPVRILDIAHQMVELSGLKPDRDIEIRFTGLRPGEKLHEEIQHFSENHEKTDHSRILLFTSKPCDLAGMDQWLSELKPRLHEFEKNDLKQEICEQVPEYTPFVE